MHLNGTQSWNGDEMPVSSLLKIYKSTERMKWWERAILRPSIKSKTSFTDVILMTNSAHGALAVAAALAVAFS